MKPISKVKGFSKEQAAAYLGGIIDGEGCVYYRRLILPNGHNHQSRVVTISNTDFAIIEAISQCMDILGIEYALSDKPGATPTRKHVWTIDVRKGPAMARIRDLVPIFAPDKWRRLSEALESYRGLHCLMCGCLHDENTPGCTNCRKRHYYRAATKRWRAKKAVAVE